MTGWRGLSQATQHLKRVQDGVVEATRLALINTAEAATKEMKQTAPIDTGELVTSIGETAFNTGVLIQATAEHGWFVEYGTVKMAAQPFFNPAIEAATRDLPNNWLDALRKGGLIT